MQYWDPSSRAFVDMLDSFAHLPFLDDLAFARPSALLEPERLSVLLHEYTHLLSIQGPISIFSAYQTSMSHALHQLCLLKALHDPKGLRFFTVDSHHLYGDVTVEALATYAFMEQHSENLRFYVNFFNAYRWLLEGLALFVQWDYYPHLRLPPSSLMKFLASLHTTQQQGAELSGKTLLHSLAEVRIFERRKRRKWNLYKSSQVSHRDYLVGYLLVKRLWHLLAARDQRLRSPDLFFRFVVAVLLHDWGILTLCSPTDKDNVFDQEASLEKKIRDFQANALRRIELMDAAYVSNLVDHLVLGSDSFFGEMFDVLYSSSPDHDDVLSITREEWEEQIVDRLRHGIDKHFAVLFKDPSAREALRKEHERITASSMELFQLIRSHHSLFKLRSSYCRLLGFQPIRPFVRILVVFPGGPYYRIQDLSSDQANPLLEALRESGDDHVEFPWDGIDLSDAARLDEAALRRVMSKFDAGVMPLELDVYDLYDVVADQWIHLRTAAGKPAMLLDSRNPGQGIVRDNDIREIAGRLKRSSYWERLTVPMGVFPNGGDYFYNYLNVDGWDASSTEFLAEILRSAWRILFAGSVIDDKELDLLWSLGFRRIIARSQREHDLCEALCSEMSVDTIASDGEKAQDIERMNRRWFDRTGTLLIDSVENDGRPPEFVWLY